MRRVIRKQVRHREEGLNVAADVSAVVAVNRGGAGETTTTHSHATQRVVQDSRAKRRFEDDGRKPNTQEER
jgi:hypothetical protein